MIDLHLTKLLKDRFIILVLPPLLWYWPYKASIMIVARDWGSVSVWAE